MAAVSALAQILMVVAGLWAVLAEDSVEAFRGWLCVLLMAFLARWFSPLSALPLAFWFTGAAAVVLAHIALTGPVPAPRFRRFELGDLPAALAGLLTFFAVFRMNLLLTRTDPGGEMAAAAPPVGGALLLLVALALLLGIRGRAQ